MVKSPSITRTPVDICCVIMGLWKASGIVPFIFMYLAPVISRGFESMGSPSGLINLPNKKSPTGSKIGPPVVSTKEPCPIPSLSYKSSN